MINIEDKHSCCGCTSCKSVCPKKCIEMKEDEEGFLYPQVDKEKCINCNLCEKSCPILVNKNDKKEVIDCYGGYNKNEETIMDSSSGGTFDLIAKYFLKNQGVVYGASFNEENNVHHIRVDNESELLKLRKSKYVQSETGDCYIHVKRDLEDKKLVLFTGTPCQVAGLYSYLKKDYDNLYTQDVICHGVPSKKVWQKYLKEKEIIQTNNINFRDKQYSWENFSIKLGNNYESFFGQDSFMKTFLSNRNLRPSCFNCKFKDTNRFADITLGDFWGVKRQCPEIYNEKGVSAILIHTDKGKHLLESIEKEMVLKKVSYEQIVAANSAYHKSVKENKNRKKFFENLDKYDMDKLCKKYCELSFSKKVINKIKRIAKKVLNVK